MLAKSKSRWYSALLFVVLFFYSSSYAVSYTNQAKQDALAIHRFDNAYGIKFNKQAREFRLAVERIDKIGDPYYYRAEELLNLVRENLETILEQLEKLPVKTAYGKDVKAILKECYLLVYKISEHALSNFQGDLKESWSSKAYNEFQEMEKQYQYLSKKLESAIYRLVKAAER